MFELLAWHAIFVSCELNVIIIKVILVLNSLMILVFLVLSVMIRHANTEEIAWTAFCGCTKLIFNVLS